MQVIAGSSMPPWIGSWVTRKSVLDARRSSFRVFATAVHGLATWPRPAIGLLGMSYLGQLSSFQAAASEAQRHSLTLVSAAGDQGQSVHFDACEYTPGFVPSVLTVGATDRRDAKSGFSNGGDCVNVMAPGEGLVSAGCDADDAELRNLSGSGYAAALAAGAAALMLSEPLARAARGRRLA